MALELHERMDGSQVAQVLNDELVALRGLQVIGNQRREFRDRRYEFMDTIGQLLVTKSNGTILQGGLNPNHVSSRGYAVTRPDGIYFGTSIQCAVEGNQPDREPSYGGDSDDIAKIFVASDRLSGRVVGVQPPEVDYPHKNQVGVWVWPKGYRNPVAPKADYLDLLAPTAIFVPEMTDTTLPDPRTHQSPYVCEGMD